MKIKYSAEESASNITLPETRKENIKELKKLDFVKAHHDYFQNTANRVKNSGLNVDNTRIKQIEDNTKSYNNPIELKP